MAYTGKLNLEPEVTRTIFHLPTLVLHYFHLSGLDPATMVIVLNQNTSKGGNMAWLYLAIAIFSEVVGTLALKISDGFVHPAASTVCVIAYGIAFYCLSLVVKTVPVGIAYAIWAGAGIVLITLLSALWFKQIPDLPAILGMGLIIAGVLTINVFSDSVSH